MDRGEAERWIREHIVPTGPVELAHEEPWASVLRVPTADGSVWFKAAEPVQAFEPRLTAALASRWPDRLPEVLGVDEERAWLLLGDAGRCHGVAGPPEPWLDALPLYAELQRGEVAHAAEHLAGGVPDRRLERLPGLYEDLLAHDLPLESAEVERLGAFAPRFAELCVELAARGVPESIQHDDLHGNNLYRQDGRLLVLDWGDSCVSHPFVTAVVTFRQLEGPAGVPRGDPWFARLRDAYLEPWGRPEELRETFDLAQRVGAFAYAFKELRVADPIPEALRPAYTQDWPNVLREALAAVSPRPRTSGTATRRSGRAAASSPRSPR